MLSSFTAILIFSLYGLYKEIFRYSGPTVLLTVSRAVFIYGIIYFSMVSAITIDGLPRTVGVIQPVLLLLFAGMSRVFVDIGSVAYIRQQERSPKKH